MLKRKDLVEQFSCVVRQEIKNHQDSILATNIAINSLNEQIGELSARFSFKLNVLEQSFKLQDIRQDRLEKVFIENRSKNDSISSDMVSECKKLRVSNEILAHKVSACQGAEKEFSEKLCKSLESVVHKFDNIDSLFNNVDNEFFQVRLSISETAEKTKKEIMEIPSELEGVKEDLIKKIQEYRVDSEGIVRELAVFKKTLYVIGKEIENINIQIERLKVESKK